MISFETSIKKWITLYNGIDSPVALYDFYNYIKKLKNKYSALVSHDENESLNTDMFLARYNQLNDLMTNIHNKYELLIEIEHKRLTKAIINKTIEAEK
jgi:hypothetical protein